MSDFQLFLPICKIDKEKRTISGYASTPTEDMEGEIISLDAIKAALPSYLEWRNIREMHRPSAVGVAKEAHTDNTGLFITAKIVDNEAWTKCVEGVYKGFSIGGSKLAKQGNTITELELVEISVVDRPCNPDCRFEVQKSAKRGGAAHLVKVAKGSASKDPSSKAVQKMAQAIEALAKAKTGPRDGFQAPAPGKQPSPLDAEPEQVRKQPVGDQASGLDPVDKGGNAPGEGSLPYGHVEYADPGYRNGKKRYPIDTAEHIRAAWNYIHKKKNAGKYSPKQLSHIRSKIVSAWKSKIDPAGPPSAKKAAKLERAAIAAMIPLLRLDAGEPSFLTLNPAKGRQRALKSLRSGRMGEGAASDANPGNDGAFKGLSPVRDMVSAHEALNWAINQLRREADLERGDPRDSALADRLEAIASQIAGVASDKANHEAGEADSKKGLNMTTENTGAVKSPTLDQVLAKAVEKKPPSKASRLQACMKALKGAREARREAAKAIKAAHKALKDDFVNKAAKKDNKESAPPFAHADVMGKLQKAYTALATQKTFIKAARVNVQKAAGGRKKQPGVVVEDPKNPWYQVPPGVRATTPSDMAGASPGGAGRASQPPLYPGDGSVYPGKAAVVSQREAEALIKAARAEGELEALRRMPAAPGRRPAAFDMSKMAGTAPASDANTALMRGVDSSALQSPDEHVRKAAAAQIVGNYLTSSQFGKSIFEADFKGAVVGRS